MYSKNLMKDVRVSFSVDEIDVDILIEEKDFINLVVNGIAVHRGLTLEELMIQLQYYCQIEDDDKKVILSVLNTLNR